MLDYVAERRPPFSAPDDVVREYAAALQSYGVTIVEVAVARRASTRVSE